MSNRQLYQLDRFCFLSNLSNQKNDLSISSSIRFSISHSLRSFRLDFVSLGNLLMPLVAIQEVTPLLKLHEPLMPAQTTKPSIGICCWIGQKTRRFSRLTSQVCILALDLVFAVGKLVSSTPATVTQSALTLLSYIGVVSLPYNLHLLVKTSCDIKKAYQWNHRWVLIVSLSKNITLISNIALTLIGCAASTVGLLGNYHLQTRIYNATIIWGMTSVALGTVNTLVSMLMNRHLLGYLSTATHEQKSPILEALTGALPSNFAPKEAAEVRFCMDKDTLEKVILESSSTDLNSSQKAHILSIIQDNIHVQQRLNMGPQLALTLAGDGLLMIEKWYTPNSIESAFINLSVASVYTAFTLMETSREVIQRNRLQKATQIAVIQPAVIQLPLAHDTEQQAIA